jgi:hypothetical protein
MCLECTSHGTDRYRVHVLQELVQVSTLLPCPHSAVASEGLLEGGGHWGVDMVRSAEGPVVWVLRPAR